MQKMKLCDILKGKSQVYVAVYERWNGAEIMQGGCFYVGNGKLVALDGYDYSLDMEVDNWLWSNTREVRVVI